MSNPFEKAENFAKRMRDIADEIETLRCEIYRESVDGEKQDLDNSMFSLQSTLRNLASIAEYSYFKE